MKSLQLHKPHLLVVIGLPGAGKSFFASQFAETFHAPYLDYERYTQLTRDERAAAVLFSDTLKQLLYSGQTVVIDSRGSSKADRQEFAKLARTSKYDVLYIWVQTEPLTAEHRAVSARGAKLSISEFDERVQRFETPTVAEKTVVISGKHTYASQARTVLKRLVAEKPGHPVAPVSGNDRTIEKHRGRIIVG